MNHNYYWYNNNYYYYACIKLLEVLLNGAPLIICITMACMNRRKARGFYYYYSMHAHNTFLDFESSLHKAHEHRPFHVVIGFVDAETATTGILHKPVAVFMW